MHVDTMPPPPPIPFSVEFNINGWLIMLFLGWLIVTALALILKPKKLPVTRLGLFFCCILLLYFGFGGAKLLYVILHWREKQLASVPFQEAFRSAGYAFYGTIVFEMLTLVGFAKLRIKKISFFKLADYVAPFLILHQAFIRVGCFVTGCCYGRLTKLPWGCVFENTDPQLLLRHPTQMYSVFFLLFIYVIMRVIYTGGKVKTGVVFFSTYCLYGFFRFFVEFLRVDSIPLVGNITLAQTVCATVFILCGLGVILASVNNSDQKRLS